MRIPKIISVQPLKNNMLLVTIANGVQKSYDCKPSLELERFQLLQADPFFKAVRLASGGYSIFME